MQNMSENPLIYALGGFSVLLLMVLVGVVVLLTLYVHHLKKKTSKSQHGCPHILTSTTLHMNIDEQCSEGVIAENEQKVTVE